MGFEPEEDVLASLRASSRARTHLGPFVLPRVHWFCSHEEIRDEGKLPREAYNDALATLRAKYGGTRPSRAYEEDPKDDEKMKQLLAEMKQRAMGQPPFSPSSL